MACYFPTAEPRSHAAEPYRCVRRSGQTPAVNAASRESLTCPRAHGTLPACVLGQAGPVLAGDSYSDRRRPAGPMPGTACQVWEAQGFLVGGRWAVFMLFGND